LVGIVVACSHYAGENLIQEVPAEYRVVVDTRRGNLRHVEMIPQSESLESWSEMLTTQIFFGGVPQSTPTAFYESVAAGWRKSCPNSAAKLLHAGDENGYSVAVWALTCPQNPATSEPEHTWFKAIRGADSFYLIQKAWKRDPQAEEVRRWMVHLQNIGLCDTRPDRNHPCPAGAPTPQ
jgi:hypothetical protein